MNALVSLIFLSAASAQNGADAAAACRAAHEADPPAHIACLEEALRGKQAPAHAPAAASATREKVPSTLGSEQIEKRDSTARPEPVAVQIASVTYGADGRGLFQMVDGQVWRETETSAESQRLRTGKPYTGRIERGQVRGYRLFVDGFRRMIKVERLK